MNWKNLTLQELDEIYKEVSFKTKPYHHQLATFTFALSQNLSRLLLIHDIGLGKTFTSLALLQLWQIKGRTLVVCPNSVIKTWKEQINEHTNFSYCILKGTKQERLEKIYKEPADIFIINYEGLKLIGGKKNERGFITNKEQIEKIPFECVIIDESHHCKDSRSLQTRIARLFSRYSRYTILMTGTPIGKNTKDLFGQCLVLNNGLTFGSSYIYFLNHFYYKRFENDFDWAPKRICNICGELYSKKSEHLKTHNIDIIQYRSRYTEEKTSESIIMNAIKQFSISYKRDECLNLPERIYEERLVYPTLEQQEWTTKIIAGLKIEEIGKNIEQHITKLLQITGGFVYYENKTYTFKSNPKLLELCNLVEETSDKFIVYSMFTFETKLIADKFRNRKIEYALLTGETRNKEEEINKFLNNENCRCLIANPHCGGEGLNLQTVNMEIFYSNAFIGTILRSQAEGRIHRTGQTKSCVYLDIIMENTLDRVLFNSLKNRTEGVKEIMDYLRNKKRN